MVGTEGPWPVSGHGVLASLALLLPVCCAGAEDNLESLWLKVFTLASGAWLGDVWDVQVSAGG